MMVFAEGLLVLERWGLTDVILPFILIFAIVFAVMQKAEILGDQKKIHTVIALVLSLAVVMPHILGLPYDVVPAINTALPSVSLVLVGVVCFLLLIGIFGGKGSWAGNKVSGGIAIIAMLIVLYIFGLSVGWFSELAWLSWLSDPEIQAVLVIIIVFALIVSYIVGKDEDSPKLSGVFEDIGKAFKKD